MSGHISVKTRTHKIIDGFTIFLRPNYCAHTNLTEWMCSVGDRLLPPPEGGAQLHPGGPGGGRGEDDGNCAGGSEVVTVMDGRATQFCSSDSKYVNDTIALIVLCFPYFLAINIHRQD